MSQEKRQIKLIIEYDGTDYVGWQFQPNGISVQQVMEAALARILGEAVPIFSSGRTDAGVHARGMIASFFTEKVAAADCLYGRDELSAAARYCRYSCRRGRT